jgi:hypothetical protein
MVSPLSSDGQRSRNLYGVAVPKPLSKQRRALRSINLKDIQDKPSTTLHTGGSEECAEGTNRTTLLSNYLAKVRSGDSNDEFSMASHLLTLNPDKFGIIDQRPHDLQEEKLDVFRWHSRTSDPLLYNRVVAYK